MTTVRIVAITLFVLASCTPTSADPRHDPTTSSPSAAPTTVALSPPAVGTPRPSSPSASVPPDPASIEFIQFLGKSGWARVGQTLLRRGELGNWKPVSGSGNAILRGLDGSSVVAGARFGATQFVDPLNGWAQVSTPAGSGVAVTADGGATWDLRYLTPSTQSSARALTSADPLHAWVIVDDAPSSTSIFANRTSRVLATDDGGLSWRQAYAGAFLAGISMSSATHGWRRAVEGTTTSLFATADGGRTWTLSRTFEEVPVFMAVVGEADAWLLLGGAGTGHCGSSSCDWYFLYHTADGGRTWTLLGNPTKDQGACSGYISQLLFATSSSGWIAMRHGAGGADGHQGGILRTVDGGRTWECRTPPLEVSELSAPSATEVWALAALEPYSSDVRLWGSFDGGSSWLYWPVQPIVP